MRTDYSNQANVVSSVLVQTKGQLVKASSSPQRPVWDSCQSTCRLPPQDVNGYRGASALQAANRIGATTMALTETSSAAPPPLPAPAHLAQPMSAQLQVREAAAKPLEVIPKPKCEPVREITEATWAAV